MLLVLPAMGTALQLPARAPSAGTAAFMKKDYWEPPFEDGTAGRFSSQPGLEDPCFWTDGCEADGATTSPTMRVELTAEELARELPAMPCITTEEDCSLEAATGLAYETLAPELTKTDAALMDPCFWDQECEPEADAASDSQS